MLTERSFPSCQDSRLRGEEAGRLTPVPLFQQAQAIQESPSSLYSPYRYSIAPNIIVTTPKLKSVLIVCSEAEVETLRIIAPTDTPTPQFLNVSPKNLLSLFTLFTPEYFNGGKKCSGWC